MMARRSLGAVSEAATGLALTCVVLALTTAGNDRLFWPAAGGFTVLGAVAMLVGDSRPAGPDGDEAVR